MSKYYNTTKKQFDAAIKSANVQFDVIAFHIAKSLASGNTDPLKVFFSTDGFRDRRSTEFKPNDNGRILIAYFRFHLKAFVSIASGGKFSLKDERPDRTTAAGMLAKLPSVLDWYTKPVEKTEPKVKPLSGKSLLSVLESRAETAQIAGINLKDLLQAHDLLNAIKNLESAILAASANLKTEAVCTVASDTLASSVVSKMEKSAGYKIPA